MNNLQLTQEQKKQLVEAVEKIEGLPESQRWREYKNLLLKINPKLRPIDEKFIRDLNEDRRAQFNDFGSDKAMSIRRLLEMPRYIYDTLTIADPELNRKITSSVKGESKAAWRKLARVFPEYRIARKI